MMPDQLQWVLDHNMQIRGGHRVQIADAVQAWLADRAELTHARTLLRAVYYDRFVRAGDSDPSGAADRALAAALAARAEGE